MNMKKFAPLAVSLGLLTIVALPAAQPVLAFDANINGITNTGIIKTDKTATQIVMNIIKAALGVLSLIAVIFIMYGGFRWLTAGGNKENLDKAKEIISAAVIGLVIVLLAYIIVLFVARITTSTVNGDTTNI